MVPAQWQSSTETNLSAAMRAHKLADTQHYSSAKGQQFTWHDNVQQYQTVHHNFSKKISTTRQLCNLLQERIKSVGKCIDATSESLLSMRNSSAQLSEPLQFCQWRMDQRAQRPEREMVRDPLEVALEKEREMLLNEKTRFEAQFERTDVMVQTLTRWKDELEDDHQHKVNTLAIDEQCLGNTHQTWMPQGKPAMPHRSPLAASGASSLSSAPNRPHSMLGDDPQHSILMVRNANNEEKRQTETMQRIMQCREAERASIRLCESNAKMIAKTGQDNGKALRQVEIELTRKIEETQTMTKRLEWTIEETNRKIEAIAESMTRTGTNIRSHHEPAAICQSRDVYRSGRTSRENHGDPVTSAMERQKHCLKRNMQYMEQCSANEAGTLAKLEEAKAELLQDLQDKMKSLTIDLRCQSYAALPRSSVSAR